MEIDNKEEKTNRGFSIIKKTNRGFSIINFKDASGEECSIQKSSSANEAKIWLGVDNPKIVTNIAGNIIPYSIPENVQVFSRMLLNKEQAKVIIEALQNFIDHDDISPKEKEEDTAKDFQKEIEKLALLPEGMLNHNEESVKKIIRRR